MEVYIVVLVAQMSLMCGCVNGEDVLVYAEIIVDSFRLVVDEFWYVS